MGEWARAIPLFPEFLGILLWGAVTTIQITVGAFLVAVVIGLVLGLIQTFPARLPKILIKVYVEIFRGVPVLAQLFVLYFGLAQIGIKLEPIPVAILGFGLNGGAFLTEVFRAGLQSVHAGQLEAAFMIGMTRVKALRYVVLPQAMRVVLPPLANYAVGLLKETSLASAVAAPELSFYARNLVTKTYLSGPIYFLVALIYIAMSFPLSRFAQHLEHRFGRERAI
ncbi:polar amino acid transport system permease protein/cystine transport system permease protein [Bosea sp. BE271]|uniref:amino acid ABC transporter permease n=1 Tax=Bosea TaxID=85413 RepID=UPI002857C9E8|nr:MULTISPECIES: amino acid ABC transporter permease [Bosea]MDR6827664.1 polar amino acid transport system permease protein/cystine transport system permease protein [Bosea robiniae]MDR6894642.1 polar amino acid transport system permease protein/cystine transport system permease protein [Bosea sp. BE109]MDR7137770.1 polar amino acid transport system permease protein/cystine transport system permease protein [Bosea sp. BE168]MDR7174469.1 polar amino acid transport system permease protein/cystine